jgi:hypothetical protein
MEKLLLVELTFLPALLVLIRILTIIHIPSKRSMILFFKHSIEKRLSGSFTTYETGIIEYAYKLTQEAENTYKRIN